MGMTITEIINIIHQQSVENEAFELLTQWMIECRNMLIMFLKIKVVYLGIIWTVVLGIMWISGIVYLISKGYIFNRFYHDIIGWHLPDNKSQEFDGCNIHAHCKFCGKEIIQDSQGNWF